MKKSMYLLAFCLSLCAAANGQRMLPGQKAIEADFGLMSTTGGIKDYMLNLGLTIQTGMGNYFACGIGYLRQQGWYRTMVIPLETFLVEGGYSIRLLGDFRRTINLNGSATAVAGYERINKGDSLLYDGSVLLNKSHLVYGFGGRISAEIYATDQLVLLLYGGTKLLWGTTRSQIRPAMGIGVRIGL